LEILFSAIFTIALVSGYLLSTYASIDVTLTSKLLILVYFCGALVIWGVILFGLVMIKQWCLRKPKIPKAIFLEKFSDKKLWLITSLIIFICYLPVILSSFSVLTPDSWSSIGQSTGAIPLSNGNPIIFTAFVGIFIHIGLLFGSLEFGTLLFSLAQSAVLAMIFSQIIVWMRRENIGKGAIIATLLFYAILPINAVAGIIMWKDILFTGFGLLFLLMLRQLYTEKDKFFTKKNVFYFISLAFLFCTWRNNGIYAYVPFLVLIVAINHKIFLKTKYLLMLFSPIFLYVIYSNLTSLISVSIPPTVTMSVPIQQISRTVKYYGSSISKEDRNTINEVLPFEQLGAKYNPNLSDPVENLFNAKVFNKNKEKYINLWLKLFMEHKKTYMAAYLYNAYGYIYPFLPSSNTTDIIIDNASDFNATKGYSYGSYISGGKVAMTKYRDIITSIMPIVRNIGFFTFVILLGAYVAIIKRRRELTGVFIILLCLFLTTILGPVNGEFRYLYLFVVATPFIIGAVYSGNNLKKSKENHG
jgi:hypothetical protein